MRAATLTSLSTALLLTVNAQEKFIDPDYSQYFNWFHQRSQTELLYTPSAELYVFESETPFRQTPSQEGRVLSRLSPGQKVTKLAATETVEDQINGYDDIWYHVSMQNAAGEKTEGYVWGAYIAKAWQITDLDDDAVPETILLGVSSQPRSDLQDINGEIKIMREDEMLVQQEVPGMCLFEECASSALLRVIKEPLFEEVMVIEASTMTVGCEVSIEKNYYSWNGSELQNIMHGEFAFRPFVEQIPFVAGQKKREDGNYQLKVCSFIGEDEEYNPVWECKTVVQPAIAGGGLPIKLE